MRRRLPLIIAAVLGFLVVSGLLARYLSTEGRERTELIEVLRAQIAGDGDGMLAAMDPSCARTPRCAAQTRANARRLRLPGDLKILNLRSDTSYALGGATGTTRIVWTVIDRGLPTVQCATVRRKGNVLAGRSITVLALSAPIGREASCP